MKVLLDENIPHQLRPYISAHETITAAYAGFAGLKNGAVLKAAEDGQFDVLVTADKTIQDEQNMVGRKISLVSLSVNNWRILKNCLPAIANAVDNAAQGSFTRVGCDPLKTNPNQPARQKS